MRSTLTSLAAALALILAGSAAADTLQLAPPGAGDQIVKALSARKDRAPGPALERAPVAMSWALDGKEPLAAVPAPFTAESREYWRDADEAALRRGVVLTTTSPQALVRISPHAGNTAKLRPDELVIRAGGRQFAADEAIERLADAEALRQAGMDVAEGTVILKLAAILGKGEVELAIPAAQGKYLIHVFEPQSTQVMQLRAGRDTVIAGTPLEISVQLPGVTTRRVTGLVAAPDGHSQPLSFQRAGDGSYKARVQPDAAHAGGQGLWEVHAFADGSAGSLRVQRDARTAFAVAAPTARLDGTVQPATARDGGLSLRIGVEVAQGSRYQLSGVLYGTAKDGSRQPVAYAQSAAWLEAGKRGVDLSFDAATLGLSPPYELRDLRLSDQANLAVIERREFGVGL
ncbi:DUF4785 family protein [Tahibacter amnicola]|uniref:DUF4785 family protein n=1 Tax=Tahibacter amnicola TaxID=2976241 RepID=A0ABY6B9M1_9GAMM|nr:DUF4785 family protein [Tahibacter amnicola]UXI66724.1 DUF4785 family protein [Tahibacter amnicola]